MLSFRRRYGEVIVVAIYCSIVHEEQIHHANSFSIFLQTIYLFTYIMPCFMFSSMTYNYETTAIKRV